jgi:hypothetical protein
MECPSPQKPKFFFELTPEAAEKNFLILKRYNMSLENALEAQRGSPLGYGLEFKPPEALHRIFRNHPLWGRMRKILLQGSNWPLEDMDETSRVNDLQEALKFGNHKGAMSKPDLLRTLIESNVTHRYGLVLPRNKIDRIPGACIAPMNIMHQFTLDASRDIVDKERLTHDQSFCWKSEFSVNGRVKKDELQQCMYGRCLMRILCWIVEARRQYPTNHILLQKIDIKSAYRRCHLNAKTAIQTITQLPDDDICVLML